MSSLLTQIKVAAMRWYFKRLTPKIWADFTEGKVGISELQLDIPGGQLPARMYHGAAGHPVILFFHGGGWVVGDLDSHHPFCSELSARTRCTILSVDYRLAPEHPYPAALDDALAAYDWLEDHIHHIAPNNGHIIVAGDSAGGNLAAAVAFAKRDKAELMGALLIYPATDHYIAAFPSYEEHRSAKPLGAGMMRWFFDVYLGDLDPGDPGLARGLVNRQVDLTGFPQTLLVTAELDPLRDDGRQFMQRLKTAGISVDYIHFEDEAHGFATASGYSDGFRQFMGATQQWLNKLAHRVSDY